MTNRATTISDQRLPLDEALAAGWKPCPDCRAADPRDKPRSAIGLYARGGRLAWLVEDDDGRHVLELGHRRDPVLVDLERLQRRRDPVDQRAAVRLQELKRGTADMPDDQVTDLLVAYDYRLFAELAPDDGIERVYCSKSWTRAGLRHLLAAEMLLGELAQEADDNG